MVSFGMAQTAGYPLMIIAKRSPQIVLHERPLLPPVTGRCQPAPGYYSLLMEDPDGPRRGELCSGPGVPGIGRTVGARGRLAPTRNGFRRSPVMARWGETFRLWGTTAAERERIFPCDELLPDHNEAY